RQMDRIVVTTARIAPYVKMPHVVVPHGVDTSIFAPAENRNLLRRDLGLDPGSVVTGCIGRIRPEKGTDLFVDAMIALLPDRPGHEAVILGGVTPKFERFARDLRDRVAAAGLS